MPRLEKRQLMKREAKQLSTMTLLERKLHSRETQWPSAGRGQRSRMNPLSSPKRLLHLRRLRLHSHQEAHLSQVPKGTPEMRQML
jgi:hypothetical protein